MASAELTIKIENIKELEEVQKYIDELKRKAIKYHRLYQKANGAAMRYARNRDYHLNDKQLYERKIKAILAVLPDDATMHNAPDYIVHFKQQMSAHSKQANHYQRLYEDLRKNSMSIDKVQEMALEFINKAIDAGDCGADYYTHASVAEEIKEWRKNNDR